MQTRWLLVALLAGCYAPLDLPIAGTVSGTRSNGDAAVDCSQYTSAETCELDSACQAGGCTECGTSSFVCVAKGSGPLECPAVPCDVDCTTITTEDACDADGSCVAVYEDLGTCDCAGAGCCMVFARCDAAPVDCATNGPDCGLSPIMCGEGYEQLVENGCVSGCVKTSSCPIPD